MPKPEIEFSLLADAEWRAAEGYPPGVKEKVLANDPETGALTRLLRFEPGARTTQVLAHDFWEEVYILEGKLIQGESVFEQGSYACRPPGMLHGPYYAPEGCTTFEVRYYL
ncbi:MAG: cupin domain-containing protein [Bacillota bacterium]|nr:cupin domain-containing protein [Bacillota bacterium]